MFAQDTVLINAKNIDSLKTEVFGRYKVTEEDYHRTLEFYNNSTERWEKFFDRVIEYVQSLKTKTSDSTEVNASFWPRLYVKVQN